MNLRTVLKNYREDRRFTLKHMAKILNLSSVDLCRFEQGRELSSRKIAKILYWLLIDG